MTRIRRAARGLGVLALGVPLSGAGLLLAAAPAYAGGGITAPGDAVVYDLDTTVRIRADITGTTKVDLKLKSPTGAPQVVDSGQGTITNNNASLSYDLDTSCADYPSASCSGRAPAPNGTWTITLSGGATDSSTFVLRIPPRAPSNLTARADGYRAVVLGWRKGDEPDLTGWTLYDGDSVVQDGIGTDACSGSACSTTVTYATDGTGNHTYSLTAHRSTAPGSSDTLESSRSSSASATLDSPPPPPPSPSSSSSGSSTGSSTGGSTGGGTGGGTSGGTSSTTGGSTGGSSTGGSAGGSTSGSTGGTSTGGSTGAKSSGSSSAIGSSKAPATIAQRRAFALTFKAFAPKLGIPKLPPLPATPAVAPLPDGTYGKTLGYKDVVKTEKVETPQAVTRRVTGAVGSALDSSQFLRSIAGALVLMLAAAHLRRWLGSSTHE